MSRFSRSPPLQKWEKHNKTDDTEWLHIGAKEKIRQTINRKIMEQQFSKQYSP